MSELCKIESPISLHLMSLNFEKKKGKKEAEKQKKRVSRRELKGEEENESAALFLGKLIQYKSGCKCL